MMINHMYNQDHIHRTRILTSPYADMYGVLALAQWASCVRGGACSGQETEKDQRCEASEPTCDESSPWVLH